MSRSYDNIADRTVITLLILHYFIFCDIIIPVFKLQLSSGETNYIMELPAEMEKRTTLWNYLPKASVLDSVSGKPCQRTELLALAGCIINHR